MSESLRLLCVLAHPDDESMGTGGILAKYAAEGVETFLLTATRGERGWQGPPEENPGLEALGRLRTNELEAAARVLGLKDVRFLDYLDGELDLADPLEALDQIAEYIQAIKPQVVVSFGPDGGYGHPDHIAISQLATSAVIKAAGAEVAAGDRHQVSKMYYRAFTEAHNKLYRSVFGDLVFQVDGVRRESVLWEEWAITTRIDTEPYWPIILEAVACHRSQLKAYQALIDLPEEQQKILWGCRSYYRVFSLVNGGRQVEDDLFAGLR